jgi:hypothetical protein
MQGSFVWHYQSISQLPNRDFPSDCHVRSLLPGEIIDAAQHTREFFAIPVQSFGLLSVKFQANTPSVAGFSPDGAEFFQNLFYPFVLLKIL